MPTPETSACGIGGRKPTSVARPADDAGKKANRFPQEPSGKPRGAQGKPGNRSLPNAVDSSLAAILAGAVHFQRLRLRAETQGPGLGLDQLGYPFIADFLRVGASVTDQERHLMRLCRMVAGDERVDRFQFVDEPVFKQEIQR